MDLPLEVISNITQFSTAPRQLSRVSRYWKESVDEDEILSLDELIGKYPGTMRTIDGDIYSTIYTSMIEAIKADDIDIISRIVRYTGYIPVNWDLLIFFAYIYGNSYVISEIESRTSMYGKAVSMLLLYKGSLGIDRYPDLPLKALKPYYLNGEVDSSIIGKLWNIHEMNIFDIFSLLPFGYIPPNMNIRDSNRYIYIHDNLMLYIHRLDYIIEELGIDIRGNIDEYKEDEDPVYGFASSIYSSMYGNEISVSHYPFHPLFLSLKFIMELDRPDLLELKYEDDFNLMIMDILEYYRYSDDIGDHTDPLGYRIREYMNHIPSIDLIIEGIDHPFLSKIV